ncbi:MAG TPA: hypothetical protein PLE61_15835 [Vicinamibacterales bacterium]|nr:hypothetical protein [Vicinamibacterales bacterium]
MSTHATFARWWKRHTHRLRRHNDRFECKQYQDGVEEPRLRYATPFRERTND